MSDWMSTHQRLEEAKRFHQAAYEALGRDPPAFNQRTSLFPLNMEKAEAQLKRQIADFESACAEFPDIFANADGLAKSLTYLAAILVSQDRFDEAELLGRRCVKIRTEWRERFPQDFERNRGYAWTCYDFGTLLFYTGKLSEASAMFRESLPIFRDLADRYPKLHHLQHHYCYVLVACPAIEFRNADVSLDYAKRALQLDPKNFDYWWWYGIAQYRSGRYQASVESIERGQDLNQGVLNPITTIVLALAHWQLGNHELARELYRQSMEEVRKSPDIVYFAPEFRVLRAEADSMFELPTDLLEATPPPHLDEESKIAEPAPREDDVKP
jgi:tetratricopeptide (TPR) repeat protein